MNCSPNSLTIGYLMGTIITLIIGGIYFKLKIIIKKSINKNKVKFNNYKINIIK